MQNRNSIYDEVAGLLVLYMITYHVIQWSGLQDSIIMKAMSFLNFFMPWFFFKGGLFFKSKDISSVFHNSFKRLMSPYIRWSLIGMAVFGYIACCIEQTHTITEYFKMNIYQLLTEGCVPGNQPLWFLFALFVVRNIINMCAIKHISILYPAIAGLIFSVTLHFTGFTLPHYINYISSGLFFYGAGTLLRNYSKSDLFKWGSILIYILLSLFCKPLVDIRDNVLYEGYYLLWPIWSIAGIVTLNTMFEYIHHKIASPIPLLNFVGKKSMLFYVIHWPIIMVIFRIILA